MPRKGTMKAELLEMREQLNASKAKRTAGTTSKSTKKHTRTRKAAPSPAGSEAAKTASDDIHTQLQDIVDGLCKEFKNANPVVLLAAFGLGILIGRLLPR